MKLKTLTCVTLAAVAGLSAMNAGATTKNLGALATPSVKVVSVLDKTGSIDDFITFSIVKPSTDSFTAVSNNNAGVLLLNSGLIGLFSGNVGSGTKLGEFSFDGTTGSTLHSVLLATAGNYYFEIKGFAAGTSGAAYKVTSSLALAPVPEPSAWALMVAGLGMIGFISHRRRQYF